MNRSAIDDIYRYYKFLQDAITVADRASEQDVSGLFDATRFIYMTKGEMKGTSRLSRDELNDMVVLTLIAALERVMQCFLVERAECINEQEPQKFGVLFGRFIERKAARWNLDEILGLFKSCVPDKLIGDLREIKQYRDLVAHGKQRDLNEVRRIPAELAYKTIDQFLRILEMKTAG